MRYSLKNSMVSNVIFKIVLGFMLPDHETSSAASPPNPLKISGKYVDIGEALTGFWAKGYTVAPKYQGSVYVVSVCVWVDFNNSSPVTME